MYYLPINPGIGLIKKIIEKPKQFISNLSIIDVIANLGWDGTRQYVISGNCDFSQTIMKQII